MQYLSHENIEQKSSRQNPAGLLYCTKTKNDVLTAVKTGSHSKKTEAGFHCLPAIKKGSQFFRQPLWVDDFAFYCLICIKKQISTLTMIAPDSLCRFLQGVIYSFSQPTSG